MRLCGVIYCVFNNKKKKENGPGSYARFGDQSTKSRCVQRISLNERTNERTMKEVNRSCTNGHWDVIFF